MNLKLFGEIERLQEEPSPPAAELHGIESYLSGLFVLQNFDEAGAHRPASIRGFTGARRRLPKEVNVVSSTEVQTMTAKYIKPELMTIVVVGDKAKISEQLAAFVAAGDSNT